MVVQDALRAARAALANTSDAPDLDANWLVLSAIGKSESDWLVSHNQDSLSPAQEQDFQEKLNRRKTGMPLAYILGQWEFYGRTFFINQDVLVPRPATENLVEQALDVIKSLSTKVGRKIIVADVGTGSGCVAITLALESDSIEKIYTTDISQAALKVAAINAEKFGVDFVINFLEGELLEPLKNLPIDLIVSNPPYVPSHELQNLTGPEKLGLEFEPKIALDGGADGQQLTNILAQSGLPTIIESFDGNIETYNT